MKNSITKYFVFSSIIFAVLIWNTHNQPNFYENEDYIQYKNFVNQKVGVIVDKKNGNLLKLKIKQKKGRDISTVRESCYQCCKKNGGVICLDGKSVCKDGTHLNYRCQSNGCNVCSVIEKRKN